MRNILLFGLKGFCGSILRYLVVILCGMLATAAQAELTVASVFTDSMVLQCDMPVPVWGRGEPGASISVEFAGQKKTTLVDSSKRWKLVLDPLSVSSKSRKMSISARRNSKTETLNLTDVLIGEVWIASGQSNMKMGINSVPQIKALVPKAENIRTFNVKRTVAFTEQETCEGTWLKKVPNSAVAFSFAYFLESAADVPVGIILTCWSSSSIEAWMPRDMTATVPHFKTMMEEFDTDTKTRKRIAAILEGPKHWSRKDDIFLRRQANILYNAMMHPLAPYACRGLVWYQGERNTQTMFGMPEKPWYSRNSGMLKYGNTLEQWIQRYRKEWNNDNMHFLLVMLPGYYKKALPTGPQKGAQHPATHSWAWMRESQLQSLKLPHTGVANTIDLGDLKNIHPKDKLPVGRRLALLAARDTLGLDVEAHGPMLKTVERKGDHLVVHFDHADGLKTSDGAAPTAFWLADDSKKWVRAEAKIKGQTVVLRFPELTNPLYVRYAFAGKPNVNLVNSAGLPAYPFRTDHFNP